MRFSKVFLAVAALLALAHCSLKPSDGTKAQQAMYSIDSVVLSNSQIVSSDTAHVEKLFNIKVCLRDEATLKPIVSEAFEVRGGDQPLARTTNSEGCFFWPERMTYNATAVPVYLAVTRELVATGSYQMSASVSLPLALSPWRDKDCLADLRYQSVEPLVPAPEVAAALDGKPTSVTPTPGTQSAGLTPGQKDPTASCQPRLNVASASYTFGGNRYSVDAYLSLKVIRPMDLSIHPKLVRCQNLDQAVTVMDDLRAGLRLRAELIFALGTVTLPHVISRFTTEAFVNSRSELEFRVPLVSPFSDEIAVRNRVLMRVVLTPLDPAAGSAQADGLAYIDGIGRLTSRSLVFLESPAALTAASQHATWQKSDWPTGTLEEPASTLVAPTLDLVFPPAKQPQAIHRVELKENDLSENLAPSTPWTFSQLTAFLGSRATLNDNQRQLRGTEVPLEISFREFLRPLCDASFSGKPDGITRCRANPMLFFNASVMEIVDKIEAPPRFVPPLAPNPLIQVSALFYHGASDNTNRTQGSSHNTSNENGDLNLNGHEDQGGDTTRVGYGGNWEAGYKLLANGASSSVFFNTEHYTGTRWVQATQDTHGAYERRVNYDLMDNVEVQEHRAGLQAMEIGSLRAETVTLELALSLHVCLLVGPQKNAAGLEGFSPYLVCTPVPHQRRTENWYYLTDSNSSLDMTAWQTAWVRTIRGESALRAFRLAMENSALRYRISESDAETPKAPNPSVVFQLEQAAHSAVENSAYPGVLDIFAQPASAAATAALLWPLDSIRTTAQACERQAVLHGASVTRAGTYCECIYRNLAERCTYQEYQGDTRKWDDLLKQDGTENRCLNLARK